MSYILNDSNLLHDFTTTYKQAVLYRAIIPYLTFIFHVVILQSSILEAAHGTPKTDPPNERCAVRESVS